MSSLGHDAKNYIQWWQQYILRIDQNLGKEV